MGRVMNAGCFFVVAGLVALAGSVRAGQHLEPAAAGKKAAKPADPALAEVQDVAGLPRVLLIGDSISIGYTLPVRARLKGVANVHRPRENCGDTARGLANLDAWLGPGPWDVIHFNFGLHDLKYLDAQGNYVEPGKGKQVAPPEVYRRRLREVTQKLKATGAKLIFATTTPVPPGTLGRAAGDEMVYNDVARDVMKELDVPVNDLHAYVVERRPEALQLPANVHFTPNGYDRLAEPVAARIKNAL